MAVELERLKDMFESRIQYKLDKKVMKEKLHAEKYVFQSKSKMYRTLEVSFNNIYKSAKENKWTEEQIDANKKEVETQIMNAYSEKIDFISSTTNHSLHFHKEKAADKMQKIFHRINVFEDVLESSKKVLSGVVKTAKMVYYTPEAAEAFVGGMFDSLTGKTRQKIIDSSRRVVHAMLVKLEHTLGVGEAEMNHEKSVKDRVLSLMKKGQQNASHAVSKSWKEGMDKARAVYAGALNEDPSGNHNTYNT